MEGESGRICALLRPRCCEFLVVVCLFGAMPSCAVPGALPGIPSVRLAEFERQGRWVLIDTRAETVTVFENDRPIAVFENLAFGSGRVGEKKRRGDSVTPVGIFRITSVRRSGRFGTFIGLNYPSRRYAEEAWRTKRIGRSIYDRILKSLAKGEAPPQDTVLGGHIGIHGVGQGKLHVHRAFNWTDGCVALDNDQIQKLAKLVRPGLLVEVR